MNVAVTGASGLIGSALVQFLATCDCRVRRVVRGSADRAADDVAWDPQTGRVDAAAWDAVDAVVHLAGENIAQGRWTAKRKARIRDSRVQGTANLCRALAELPRPPRVLLSASAVGFYGSHADETLDETSPGGEGFLADVCRQWETATQPAADRGIRVVLLRFGMVLSPHGGALAKMLPAYRFGLGGRIGDGKQVISWISLDDAVGAVYHAMTTDAIRGPVNIVSPEAVTNARFSKTLGRVLHRPTIAAMPGIVARCLFGQMADELLLAGADVTPRRLMESGFSFRHPSLEPALRELLAAR